MPRGQNAAPTVEQISKDRITLVTNGRVLRLSKRVSLRSCPNNIGRLTFRNGAPTIA